LERDAVDAAASGAHRQSQGEMNLVSDQAARRRTALFSPSPKLWRTGPSKPLVQTGRGRQSRVVLAPVAGVKSAEASRPDRAWQNLNPPTTVTRRIRSPGRAAQGRPGVPVNLWWLRSRALFYFAREAAGAAGTRLSLRPLLSEGHGFSNLGHIAPRERESVF